MSAMKRTTDPAIAALTQRRRDSPNGAGHYHITDPYKYRITVRIDGVDVAESTDAMILKEVGKSVYNPSFYIPLKDVNFDLLRRVDGHSTFCPIKGEASYWDFESIGVSIEKAAWSYKAPLPYSEMISGYLGFDQRFATIEIGPLGQ